MRAKYTDTDADLLREIIRLITGLDSALRRDTVRTALERATK
ncbi:hypothetical protein ACFV8E_10320 [Streptomyces sp. NPDC059849]